MLDTSSPGTSLADLGVCHIRRGSLAAAQRRIAYEVLPLYKALQQCLMVTSKLTHTPSIVSHGGLDDVKTHDRHDDVKTHDMD